MTKTDNEDDVRYFTFPNNYSIISVFEKIKITFLENKAILTENKKSKFSSDLICNYKKPIELNYIGGINEITFYFKPLGLNAFLPKNLSSYTNDFFSNFVPFDDYEEVMKKILNEKNQTLQCKMIEDYWLSKLVGFNHPFLNNVILDLKYNDISVSDLAKKHKTSRQNLSKHFEINLCKSPSDFKKIQRFRDALKTKIDSKNNNNLTTLGCDMLFYDQSHLIKDFKSLTGLTPKIFFKNLTSPQDSEINWLFLH